MHSEPLQCKQRLVVYLTVAFGEIHPGVLAHIADVPIMAFQVTTSPDAILLNTLEVSSQAPTF